MTDTKTKILDVAERLTQTRGFNGFSYIDLSDEVGVKTSSIHYHFKTKADLGLALVDRVRDTHAAAFNTMNGQISSPEKRLAALVDFFQGYVKEDKFCLCGMLAAELQSVSPTVRRRLEEYFQDLRTWIAAQLREMGFRDAKGRSLSFLSALEGSVLLARLSGEPMVVSDAMKTLRKR